MVKLDNWQTKAEKAAERRWQSKQEKEQKHRTRRNKALGQQFLSFLQEHGSAILHQCSSTHEEIHIWVDVLPSSSRSREKEQPDNEDFFASSSHKKGGRPRTNSCNIESDNNVKGRKGRARSNSDTTATTTSIVEDSPRLCAQHFFGFCSSALVNPGGGRRKSTNSHNNQGNSGSICGCIHGIHPSTEDSLASVLLGKSKKGKKQTGKVDPATVEASQKALEASRVALPTEQSTSMYILHHLSAVASSDSPSSTSLADTVTRILSDKVCSIGSIVYVVFRNLLVFDRYRNGRVLSSHDEELLLCGGSRRRSISMSDHSDSNISHNSCSSRSAHDNGGETLEETHQRLVQNLPSQVLEYILRFLPDSATASLPRVCKAWYREIGKSSPDLWRHLLDRHEWPLPALLPIPQEQENDDTTTTLHRQAFVSHYLAARDVKAVTLGMSQFMGDGSTSSTTSSGDSSEKDLAMFQFKESIGRPVSGPTMVALWSDTRVLAGSAMDCTLHLYDVIDSSSVGSGKRCKQSLRVSVAPFANTRRRHCMLAALKLDRQAIGCLYEVGDQDRPPPRRCEMWLGVLSRDELLCTGKGGSGISQLEEDILTTFNLQSKVFEFLQTTDDNEIVNWLYNHGLSGYNLEMSFLSIVICNTLVACEHGQYLFEAHISLAADDMDSFFEPDLQFPTLGKVFLFSSSTGNISWVSPSNCDSRFPTLTQVGQSVATGGGGRAHAAFLSNMLEAIVIHVQGPGMVLCSHVAIPNPICGTPRFVAMTATDLVLADEWIGSLEGSSNGGNLHFLSLNGGDSVMQEGILNGTFFGPTVPMRDDYLLAFATADKGQDEHKVQLVARLFHIPRRQMIEDVVTGITYCPEYLRRHSPVSTACEGGAIAVAIDDAGLFMAGHQVSALRNETCGRKVKRKKGILKNRPKKDVFARGMRQSMG